MLEKYVKSASHFLSEQFYQQGSNFARLHPYWNLRTQKIDVVRDVPYLPTGSPFHRLDIYRGKQFSGNLPVVFYIHGGGFKILSKESHWIMAQMFARQGYVVFNINYRLSDVSPFPAAIDDVFHAYLWTLENAHLFGGDTSNIIIAGESAGANLTMALGLAHSHDIRNDHKPVPRHPEYRYDHVPDRVAGLSHEIFERNSAIRALLPACGLYQVSHPQRFAAKTLPLAVPLIEALAEGYLPGLHADEYGHPLADPLIYLEKVHRLERELPPVFLSVGGWDPIRDDTHRLFAALQKIGADVECREYPFRHHAFHAFYPLDPMALQCWDDHFAFLKARSLMPAGS